MPPSNVLLRCLLFGLAALPWEVLFARDVNPVLVSTLTLSPGATTVDVVIADNILVAAQGSSGVSICSLTNGFNRTVATPDYAGAVAISGKLALVADGFTGLEVIEFSDLLNAKIVSELDTPGNAVGICVAGNLAYIADGGSGLQIIDISNPFQPTLVGGYNTFGMALSVAVSGNYAFVADGDDGLQVIDVTVPSACHRVAGYDRRPATFVTISGNKAYVSSQGSLVTFDISNPLDPQPISSFNFPGSFSAMAVRGTFGFVAAGSFNVVDLSDPFEPDRLGGNLLCTGAVRVAISGPFAYVADQANGIRVFAATNSAGLDRIGSIPIPGKIRDITVSGNYVYVQNDTALRVVDATRPQSMRTMAVYPNLSPTFADKYAYVYTNISAQYGTQVFDISDPTNWIPKIFVSGTAVQGAYGNHVFSSSFSSLTYSASIGMYEVSDFGFRPLGGYRTPDNQGGIISKIFAYSNVVAFSSNLGRNVLNTSNPTNIYVAASIGGFTDISFSGRNLYYLGGGLSVLNLDSFQGQYFPIPNLPLTAESRLKASNQFIYLGLGRNGVAIAHLDSSGVSVVGGNGIPDATAIGLSISNVFVGAGTNGLYALTLYNPAIEVKASLSRIGAPSLSVSGPIGFTGWLQKATNVNGPFDNWQFVQLGAYPQTNTDTVSQRMFYRFASPGS